MRRIIVVTVACVSLTTVCMADDAKAPARKFTDIPPEPLGVALRTLAKDRDLQVAYVSDEVESVHSSGASGELTTDEALVQLLRGTGLTYRHSGVNGISIVAISPPTPVHSPGHRDSAAAADGHSTESGAQGEKKAGRSFWDRFRVAHVDQGKAAVAGAQVVTDPPATEQGTHSLQEIVITAQRRSENLQAVPIAATALRGSDLAGKAVTQLNDLQYAAPSLSIGNAGLSNTVNIRGVGLASGSPAVANGVAVYVDGLFQTPTVNSNQFYDIADVEVLRGPQGTLVGANSTGGAIFINSRSPALDVYDGYVEVGGGSYNAWTTQGAVNLPINDVLAVRAAGEFTQHESFYRSSGPAYTDAGSLYEKAGRLGILFKPGAFQALGKFDFVDRNTGGYAVTPVPGTKYAPYAPVDPFVLEYDTPDNLNHERELSLNLELRYEFMDGITLRSQSGYIDKPVHNYEDYDGTAVDTVAAPRVTYDQNVRGQQWTQEINLLSTKKGDYDWVVGGYFARNNIDVNIYQTGTTGPGGPALYLYSPQKKTTTGWFGQLNVKLAPRWELQAGLRYSTYSARSDGFASEELPGCPRTGCWRRC